MIPDPRRLPPRTRLLIAARAKRSADAREFCSQMRFFNSEPCARHDALEPGCLDCGISLRRHQRVGTAWLWFAMRGLLADSVGLGKTAQVAGVLALAKQTGELSYENRAVITCRAAAVGQWAAELRRMLPSVQIIAADGLPDKRMRAYLGGWEVCVISDRTLAPAGQAGKRGSRDGDIERLRQFPVGIVVYDDIDAMRNGKTRSAWAIKKLASTATRVIGVHGTPLQKRLLELYYFLQPVGGVEVFGTENSFRQEYVVRDRLLIWLTVARGTPAEKNAWARKHNYPSFGALVARANADRQAGNRTSPACQLVSNVQAGRARFQRVVWKDSGINEARIGDLKRTIAPMVLRRTVSDLDDVELPEVQVNNVWLELSPGQRTRMNELKTGTLRRLRDTGVEVSPVEAGAAFTRARQINSGLAALDDGRDDSVKLDWVMDRLTGDLAEDKVIVFVYFKPNISALSARLEAEGIGHVLFWSEETDKTERERRRMQFLRDPDCKVLVGSPTIEASLNLQVAGHLIAADQIWNPQRMEQLLGRMRRQGSAHRMVIFHQLLIRDTVDDGFLELMEQEQGISDQVWEDRGEIYSVLTPVEVMRLVATGTTGREAGRRPRGVVP